MQLFQNSLRNQNRALTLKSGDSAKSFLNSDAKPEKVLSTVLVVQANLLVLKSAEIMLTLSPMNFALEKF
jgi:hypothetical protein